MIVAKTRMKRIPKTCKECSISVVTYWEDRVCGINQKECPVERKPSGNIGYCKPGWCPLVEVESV